MGGGRKVKVAAKNVSGSRLESLHEELEGMTRHEETLPGSRTEKCIHSVLSQLSSRQLFLSVWFGERSRTGLLCGLNRNRKTSLIIFKCEDWKCPPAVSTDTIQLSTPGPSLCCPEGLYPFWMGCAGFGQDLQEKEDKVGPSSPREPVCLEHC